MSPYNTFHAANSKEYIALNKGAKQNFCPETGFDLIPGNNNSFSAEIEKYGTQFEYRSLLNVPTNHGVVATDANIITYKNQTNMVNTWNKMTDHIIAKNANAIWGTRNRTIPPPKN